MKSEVKRGRLLIVTVKGKTDTKGKPFKGEKCVSNERLMNDPQGIQRFDQPFKQMNKLFKWISNPFQRSNILFEWTGNLFEWMNKIAEWTSNLFVTVCKKRSEQNW